ncbi:putative RNA recognition motif domain, nucleotide-binding alpha-beta plait domain superfamily [Dioscorea sansibarensis]
MCWNPSLLPQFLGRSAMAKKASSADALQALFSVDNPFRRKPQSDPPPTPSTALWKSVEIGLGLGHETTLPEVDRKRKKENEPDAAVSLKRKKKLESGDVGAVEESPRKRRRKRKRDELEEKYERRKLGERPEVVEEKDGDGGKVVAVGEKRKASDLVKEMVVSKEDEEEFDDEEKLLRTVFVGNLPLRTKKKALMKEFGRFGEIESVRIRSVPLVDSKIPRKGAIIKGKINESVDSVHAYIVFKQEQSANAALSHNMAEVGSNHIRVDMACPPRKKLKGTAPLYDRKRTVFVGNLPFDVKDEELYRLFCGTSQSDSGLEAVRVIRDPNTSLGKGIAYVLFKTRDAANSVVRQRNLKIRDRLLRVCHAKAEMTTTKTPSKRKSPEPIKDSPPKRLALSLGETSPGSKDKPKAKAASLSYQGIRASKSGVLKKTGIARRSVGNTKHETNKAGGAKQKSRKTKRPAVAARKAKLQKKRKQEGGTPENARHNKKARKH